MSASIIAQINEIQTLGLAELRERWKTLHGTQAPGYSREHLIRRLCFRVQELAHGGLTDATRCALRAAAERDGPDGQVRSLVRRDANVGGPVPGTVFIRQWQGKRFEVTCVDGGFELDGQRYRSLTAIAKAITGAHWSGNLFFGVRQRSRRKEPH